MLLPCPRGGAITTHSAAAARLVSDVSRGGFLAPTFLQLEFASVLRQGEARRSLSREQLELLLRGVQSLPIRYAWEPNWTERALEIARLASQSKIYDSLYVACAEAFDLPLLTCDGRFVNALPPDLRRRVELVA
ncbi:MAG: type II toxin-antitoxin system VapC family toxin [Dehalococcoidia bacterium]